MKKWRTLGLAMLAGSLWAHYEYGCAVTLIAIAICMVIEDEQ